MDEIYINARKLYLVRPSIMTYDSDSYRKFEQRPEDIDVAIREKDHYYSVIKDREYVGYNGNAEFDKYYIYLSDNDIESLIEYIYGDDMGIIKHFNLRELNNFLKMVKEANDVVHIQKIRKRKI